VGRSQRRKNSLQRAFSDDAYLGATGTEARHLTPKSIALDTGQFLEILAIPKLSL